MGKIIFLVLIALVFNISTANSQNCSCSLNLDSLINSVETNYIGFNKKTAAKDKYSLMKRKLIEEAKIVEGFECYKLLKSYLSFFSDPHLNINLSTKSENTELLKQYFKSWPKLSVNIDSLKNYYKDSSIDPIEGIWLLKSLKTEIAVFKEPDSENSFIGIILSADSLLWSEGQIRMRINKIAGKYNLEYFKKDHTATQTLAYVQENQLIVKGNGTWERNFPQTDSEDVNRDDGIAFSILSSDASIIRISNFWIDKKNIIDSLISKNDKIISSREYLIIDLRNNFGGHIMSADALYPYLYDNPILIDGLQVRSSPENISIYKKLRDNPDFSQDDKATFDSIISKLESQPNTIVQVTNEDSITFDKKKTFPKKVAILTNESTMSAAELFVLWSKQSSKVITFGRRTGGALDFTEIGGLRTLPCHAFTFYCPMGAGNHKYLPYIDNIGIMPDVELEYSDKDWIKNVYEYLKEHH